MRIKSSLDVWSPDNEEMLLRIREKRLRGPFGGRAAAVSEADGWDASGLATAVKTQTLTNSCWRKHTLVRTTTACEH